jgi:hypothetical protein
LSDPSAVLLFTSYHVIAIQDLHYANRTGENRAHKDQDFALLRRTLGQCTAEVLEIEVTFLIAQDLETTRIHSVLRRIVNSYSRRLVPGWNLSCSMLAEASPERGRQRPIPTCSRDMANARKCLISAVRSSPKSFEGGPAARLGGRIASRRRIEEISELSCMRRPRRLA